MKFLVINDENELYRYMFSDILENKTDFQVEEINKVKVPILLQPFFKIHFSEKINRHMFLPLKKIWNPFYLLHKYNFETSEQYCVIFLNGSLRYYYSKEYLEKLKTKHKNIKLVMLMYDSYSNPVAQRARNMMPVFDTVYSFDKKDCIANNLEYIYSTFSIPKNIVKSDEYKTNAFFVGYGAGRMDVLKRTFQKISNYIDDCKFIISGVKKSEEEEIKNVIYNIKIPYEEELNYAYNTNCIVEVVRNGQSGITLRTCEAIAFNKKLITNNKSIKDLPFYDERYIYVFDNPDNIDVDFINKSIDVKYKKNDCFSPINILKKLKEKYE